MSQHISFKTNINCANCVRAISSFLNENPAIQEWSVDTRHTDKILKVETELQQKEIIEIVQNAGFDIEVI